MECSICYDAISATTGKAELGCGHGFHIRCLMKWFDQQYGNDCSESCPLCRHEATEFEQVARAVEYDEESEDDESESGSEDSEESEWPTIDELAAQERARFRFARYKTLNPKEEVEKYAACLITALGRGWQARKIYAELVDLRRVSKANDEQIAIMKKENDEYMRATAFYQKLAGMPHLARKRLCAVLIQSTWRRHVAMKSYVSRPTVLLDSSVRRIELPSLPRIELPSVRITDWHLSRICYNIASTEV